MIIGIGTDLIDMRRVEKVWQRYGKRFEQRMFTQHELKIANDIDDQKQRIAYFSKRIAVKEAYAKALGTGIGKKVKYQDISVENSPKGQPFIRLVNQEEDTTSAHVSISDQGHLAQAFVVIEDEH